MNAAFLFGSGMLAGVGIFALAWVLVEGITKAPSWYRALSDRDGIHVVVKLQDWRTK